MKKRKYKSQKAVRKARHEAAGVLLCALGLFAALSLYIPQSAGVVGPVFKGFLMGLFGILAYLLPLGILAAGVLVILAYQKTIHKAKLTLTLLLLWLTMGLIHLFYGTHMDQTGFFAYLGSAYTQGGKGLGAGILSAPLSYLARNLFGQPGAYILMIGLLLADLLILTNLSLKKLGIDLYGRAKPFLRQRPGKPEREDVPVRPKPFIGEIIPEEQAAPPKAAALPWSLDPKPPNTLDSIEILDFQQEPPQMSVRPETPAETPSAAKTDMELLGMPIQDCIQETLPYMIPPLSLLKEPVARKNGPNQEKKVLSNAKLLEETLGSFGVSAKVVQVSRGPVITRYELQPAPGVKVNRIKNLADDIALNLAAQGVRIEAPIPGKAAIGVEVPNQDIVPVLLREVLESDSFAQHGSKAAIALGKDIAGKDIVADIAKMPHLLVAGATGSGKSVCINSLIISLLYRATPDEVKLILIDPKVVELSNYNGIPHLLVPVVTDPKKAAGALNWAVQEMIHRYKLFADKGARDMERYNDLLSEIGEARLPQIVVVIDELADLMMVAPSDVEDAICRLAQMARAAGIHLVIATQRPSVDVITGVIKANIPSRIAFAVSSQTDSRTILDMGGAEKLLGRGDMLFYPVGASKPIRVQGAFISEGEVERVVSCIKNQNEAPKYHPEVLDEIAVVDNDGAEDTADELLAEAIEIVVDAGQASISMLQRRLRVGYARAARLIDEMEVRGLVSGFNGSKTRNVLITREEFDGGKGV